MGGERLADEAVCQVFIQEVLKGPLFRWGEGV